MPRRWRTLSIDLAPAVLLLLIGLAEALDAPDGHAAAHVVSAFLQVGPVAVRRRWPLAALGVSLAGVVVEALWAEPFNGLAELLAIMLLAYSLPRHGPRAHWWPAVLLLVVGSFVRFAASPEHPLGDVFFSVVLLGACWAGGAALRRRQERVGELEQEAEAAERLRREREAAIVAEERRRIARELHDIVGHALSAISLAAGAAEQQATEGSDTQASLRLIRSVSQDAVGEMRRLLGLMRAAGEPVELSPQPRLDGLADLVDNSRRAGLEVDLAVEGEAVRLPAGLELAAYRVVQEGLTNVMKHAGGHGPAEVTLRWRPHRVEIEVEDTGPGSVPGASEGHGLLGLRERLALYAGRLEAGPRPGGGFRLCASLPIP